MHGQNRERCITAQLYHSDLCFARGFHRYAQESTLVKSVVCFLSSKEYYSPIKGQQQEQGKGGKKKKERRKDRVEEKRLLTRRRKERSKQQKPCTATVSFLSIIRSVQVILSLSFNKIVRTMIIITLIFSLSLYIDLLAE